MKLQYIGYKTKYNVEIAAVKENVMEVLGNFPMKETGFLLIDEDTEYDYSAYSTLYRTVDGGFQYSNDGEVWVEPTRDITVQIVWQDRDDYEELRPVSVEVSVTDGNELIEQITLSAQNEWKKTYQSVPQSHSYTASAVDVENYTMETNGSVIIYTIEAPYEPSTDELVSEMMDIVIDLDARVSALEG